MKNIAKIADKIKHKIRRYVRKIPLNKKLKIFCISLQRTGTTSTGQFFKDLGYSVATYSVSKKNLWTMSYFKGDYEKIFRSKDFKMSKVFEDDPWWLGDFYKVLYHRFPDAKFILLERDADKWFNSMVSHSNGRTLGNTHVHSAQYQRLKEFHEIGLAQKDLYTGFVDNALSLEEQHRDHYTNFYKIRNEEVKLFFRYHDSRRLFNAHLEDEELWLKMGRFFGVEVMPGYSVHLNESEKVRKNRI